MATSSARSSRTRSSPTPSSRARSARSRRSTSPRARPTRRRPRSRSATSCTAPRTTRRARPSGEIAADDPSWDAGQDRRRCRVRARSRPTRRCSTRSARTESDEASARGVTGTGGKLPGYITEDSGYVAGVQGRGPRPRPARRPDPRPVQDRLRLARRPGHVSPDRQGPDGRAQGGGRRRRRLRGPGSRQLRGGDAPAAAATSAGWPRASSTTQQEAAIFAAAGRRHHSDVIVIADDGTYLFKVLAEETRTPEGRQLEEIRSTAFGDWYQLKKDAVEIDPRRSHHRRSAELGPAAMLDALVTEARLRFGLDPADGPAGGRGGTAHRHADRGVASRPHRAGRDPAPARLARRRRRGRGRSPAATAARSPRAARP